MRKWIKLIMESQTGGPTVLYHGTKLQLVTDIMAHGLNPQHDVSWRDFGAGVYLTNSVEVAREYGEVIFAVQVSALDEELLCPDDHELFDFFEGAMEGGVDLAEFGYHPDDYAPSGIYECSWIDSLRIVNQCKYLGVIPPHLLEKVG